MTTDTLTANKSFRAKYRPGALLPALAVAIVFLAPLVVAFNTSLKTPAEVLDVFSLPAAPNWQNYATAWDQIGRTFWKTRRASPEPAIFARRTAPSAWETHK